LRVGSPLTTASPTRKIDSWEASSVRQRWFALCSAFLASLTALASAERPTQADAKIRRPNIVVVVTDDQRYDQLWTMPAVRSRLMALGMTFTRAFVSTPLCSPARATFLTGRYAHSTGIYANGDGGSRGGFPDFRDGSTIAAWLDSAGYRTGYFGKYLNNYERPAYVPPGWDRWVALAEANSEYYDYTLSIDGHARRYGDRPADYLTDVLKRQATSFLQHTNRSPFLMWVGVPAPHGPNIAPPRYADSFPTLHHTHHPNYNEANVRDKPRYIRRLERLDSKDHRRIDNYWRASARSLLAVDDLVARILDVLRNTGKLNNTLFVYTSDNGQAWGEHRWMYKNDPYEESVRIPLIVRWPGVTHPGTARGAIVGNVDIAPTLARAAGVRAPRADGVSLVRLLQGRAPPRHRLLLEHGHYGGRYDPPSFCGVRTEKWTFVHYATGEEELYKLTRDPYELRNLRRVAGYSTMTQQLRKVTRALCAPRPPGLPRF
jgi:N-acetylglucosamine-6-sulfatase